MIRILLLGGSITYGVGSDYLGWGDLLKNKCNSIFYSTSKYREVVEVYNFGKPGADSSFILEILDTAKKFVVKNNKKDKNIIICSFGMNDTKAVDSPTNFVSSGSDFGNRLKQVLLNLKDVDIDDLIFVGLSNVNQELTNPKLNPLNGTLSYFTNKRITDFNKVARDIILTAGYRFLSIEYDDKDWLNNIVADGVHPNSTNHQKIFNLVWDELNRIKCFKDLCK
jgi:lysophospholipase L1-like esterase